MAAYLELYRSGKLRNRVDVAVSLLESCSVCPRSCGVNRLAGNVDKCRTPREAMVSSYGPHFGEEVPLVGRHVRVLYFSLTATLDVCSARIIPLAS